MQRHVVNGIAGIEFTVVDEPARGPATVEGPFTLAPLTRDTATYAPVHQLFQTKYGTPFRGTVFALTTPPPPTS
jgi:hypothetical protein